MKNKKAILIVPVAFVLFIAVIATVSYLHDLVTLRPHWVYLCSRGKDGKTLTIFYPKWYTRDRAMYIIPGRYTDSTIPLTNYVKTHPHMEASIQVNWQPDDGRVLKFEYPLIGVKYEDHLDTTLYRMFESGSNPGFIDAKDSFHFPKYQGFSYGEWMVREYREGPF